MIKSQVGIEREDAKSSNDPLKLEYEDYLRNQRGLSERTIYHCWRFAERFLQFRFGGKARDLHKITPTDIVRFMQQLVSRGKPFRDKTPPTHLRNFFPLQERKDQRQSHDVRPTRRAKICTKTAEAPYTGAGGNANRRRESVHRHGATQLCHDTKRRVRSPVFPVRPASDC